MLHCRQAIVCPLPWIHNLELKVQLVVVIFFVVFSYVGVILFYFIFYQLLVAMIYKLPTANKVVDCRHRIRVSVVYFVAPIGHWPFCIAIYWNACSD